MDATKFDKNPYDEQYMLCHHCDLLVEIPRVTNKQNVNCPRCQERLTRYRQDTNQQVVVYSVCALIMLAVACLFFFVNIRVVGVTSNMSLFMVPNILWADNYSYLSMLFVFFVLVFPALCLLILLVLSTDIKLPTRVKVFLLVWFNRLHIWCMAEIFLAGVLVSFVKLTSYGDIGVSLSFLPYCAFVLLQIRAISLFIPRAVWQKIGPTIYVLTPMVAGKTGIEQNIRLCRCCHAILPMNMNRCPRCKEHGKVRDVKGIQWTMALLLTSIILYIPANMYSVMSTTFLGSTSNSTIMDGVIYMWQEGDYPVALVIFIASIVIPVLKILALIWLCYFVLKLREQTSDQDCLKMKKLYDIVEIIGRWSMIDIFVVSVIASLIRNGELMAVYPNIGAVFFATVVILTMIAAHKYDPRLIWDRTK
ncbi:PqiA/YebS family transporter subunit [Zophobihabitans entericus]|uniref:PqiA/YebS family transporter subunit n=1 Tax=Zophobihabitans entericus TaxID=1635327 RepID=A0A6G9ICB6_9GAMM|nr:PqiA/YebS family transporter subunit [Zophobihabitans entericus]QIQ21863.1 PqiA/YebS family transporter subunit [Zophobihabitans entericus]